MTPALPTGRLDGPLLVLAPHFDDEVLGCGGLLAGLADKGPVRVVIVCDGRGSAGLSRPAPAPGAPDIGAVRAAESRAALAALGVPVSAVSELGFPDGTLSSRGPELAAALERVMGEMKPRWVLAPFRFDRHPDHMALGRAALALDEVKAGRAALLEYFVYYRFRLFPGGDIRRIVKPELLQGRDLAELAFVKRRALDCFVTQTTRYFPWQGRPVLTEALLREVAAGPELFLSAPAGAPDGAVLKWPAWLVRLIVAVEPALKRAAYAWRLKRRLKRSQADE
jgi:LmbE family N-acetylglucosaminyl deacetylase